MLTFTFTLARKKRAKFKQGKKWKLAAIDFLYFGFRLTVGRCYSFYLFRECKHLTPLSVCFSSKWFFFAIFSARKLPEISKDCMLFVRMVNVYFNVRTHAHSSHGTCEEFAISSLLLSLEFKNWNSREREENFTTFRVQIFHLVRWKIFLNAFTFVLVQGAQRWNNKNCHTLTLPTATFINFARLFFHRFSDYFLKLFFFF